MDYLTKQQKVQAFKWVAGPEQIEDPSWIAHAIKDKVVTLNNPGTPKCTMAIRLPDRSYRVASVGDWIVKNQNGEIYSYPEREFFHKFEKAEVATVVVDEIETPQVEDKETDKEETKE